MQCCPFGGCAPLGLQQLESTACRPNVGPLPGGTLVKSSVLSLAASPFSAIPAHHQSPAVSPTGVLRNHGQHADKSVHGSERYKSRFWNTPPKTGMTSTSGNA